jgi:dihydroorotate dehydrogenase
MLYRVARPLLFALEPETAHALTFGLLESARGAGLASLLRSGAPSLPVRAMGMEFPNPVGLAAGLDKNGEHIDALLDLGFGFVEVGAVTPRPQPGNPRPRLFRLAPARALINRMGFNNLGVDHLVANLRRRAPRGVVGVNIGRNFDTPNERAAEDYVQCLRKVYPYASFVTANISSPNTSGLRSLQSGSAMDELLSALAGARGELEQAHGRRVPLAVKIAPDLEDAQIDQVAERALEHGIDAVIATNTTVSRAGVEHLDASREAGGLSGAPLRARSTEVVARLARSLAGRVTIIGVGGIASAEDAREKLAAGATLVQLYTALIYQGPALVGDIVRGLAQGRA